MTDILMIDGYNLLHRARSGFTQGDHAIAYNFFRGLRALVEKFAPRRAIMALEGHPKYRYELLSEYKANRRVDSADDESSRALESFNRQRCEILALMALHFPVSLVRHPDHEADDTISNIIARSSTVSQFTVISTDADHTQLLCQHANVNVYNPVKKSFVEWSIDDDYIAYKALKGDGSDNIPGVPKFGEKTAMKWAKDSRSNPIKLQKLLQGLTPQDRLIYERNVELVRFAEWSDDEAMLMTSSNPERWWDYVKRKFDEWEFASITKEPTWSRFVATFDPLFGSLEGG